MKSIALIGFMGSGKSTVGPILAEKAGLDFVDLDDIAQALAGMDVTEIFLNKGEEAWRAWETKALREIVAGKGPGKERVVLACGGGIVIKPENRQLLRSEFLTCYLKTSLNVLTQRLATEGDRPLLDHKSVNREKAIEKLFNERRAAYEAVPHAIILTDGKRPEEVAVEIMAAVIEVSVRDDR